MATQCMSADREKKRMALQGSPEPPLEDDNILSMILVRLPPLPSSLPRAALACKRWRSLVTHPHFRRSFLAHHKKAPLLGFFCYDNRGGIDFKPTLDPPNHMSMPPAHFSRPRLNEPHNILGCHHGRLLVVDSTSKQKRLVVWDPITDDRRHINLPKIFKGNIIYRWKGVVVCASREKDHVHGACHSEPFQVVTIVCSREGFVACVYSSETCSWGNIITLRQPPVPDNITFRIAVPADCQSSLVGNSVYWPQVPVVMGHAVLEFDLHRQTLAIIDPPNFNASIHHHHHHDQSFILPADGGGLRFILLSGQNVHVWKRISNGHGVTGWLFENTVELSSLLSLKPRVHWISSQGILKIVGRDEDDNMIFLSDRGIIYFVNLKTLQFKELPEKIGPCIAHPFTSFYTAGMHLETGMRGDKNV